MIEATMDAALFQAQSPISAPTGGSRIKDRPSTPREAAEAFEAMVVGTLLQEMMSMVPTDGYFGGGHAEEMYRGLIVEEYGKAITAAGGIGIADSIQSQMLRLQEVNP